MTTPDKPKNLGTPWGRFFRRLALVLVTLVLLAAAAGWMFLDTVLRGPSPTARDELTRVLAPHARWLPEYFLGQELVEEICQAGPLQEG